MGEPMTEAEARNLIYAHFVRKLAAQVPVDVAVPASLATADALAVLLDPETMLRAWEKAGRVELGWWAGGDDDAPSCTGWRIVPDEEGARDG